VFPRDVNVNFRADTDINNFADYKNITVFAGSCSFFTSLLPVAEVYASCKGTGGGRRESDRRVREVLNALENFVSASET